MIPYGKQDISEADIESVVAVLRSDFLTQGPAVPAFENAVAAYAGAHHAFAMNSATSALHAACLALGVGPGDRVWTSPVTFVASANCAIYCGATVDFVDIDPQTYNLSASSLEEKLVAAEKSGTLPKVVIPVHLCGQSCEMEQIHALGRKFGFRIIEDASHAIGGRYKNRPVGGCEFSDITVFSFHPVKIITTGEGGMALTNDDGLAEKLELHRCHGITRKESLMTHASDGPWYYQQINLGFNYRMTDLQAALGLSQLERLDSFVEKRNEIADRYDTALGEFPLITPWQQSDSDSARHLYVVRLKTDEISKNHRQVFEELRTAGIGVNLHYIPVHLQPYYEKLGFSPGMFPQSEKYYREAISIPLYPNLSDGDQTRVIETLSQSIRDSDH